jgi:lipopolysaccharide/colanic/teichoic acid biosynthesis glycosyltransferase
MPIIDDVRMERDHGGGAFAMTVDVRDFPSDARAFDELTHIAPLVVDGRANARAARLDELLLSVHARVKRAIDMAFAATVLLLSLPLVACVAMAVVLDSRGPVFYRAERIGRNGRPLRMLKFRKMHHNASGAPLTMSEDARFTRIGRLLARTKIDELPQLWHVLRGEMSLIGPRPEDPGFVAERSEEYSDILRVRPGITGLSQIAFAEESEILCKVDPLSHYRSRIFPQKIKLDRMYAACPTLGMDARILFWTGAAVVLRRQVAVHRETGRMNLRRR